MANPNYQHTLERGRGMSGSGTPHVVRPGRGRRILLNPLSGRPRSLTQIGGVRSSATPVAATGLSSAI